MLTSYKKALVATQQKMVAVVAKQKQTTKPLKNHLVVGRLQTEIQVAVDKKHCH